MGVRQEMKRIRLDKGWSQARVGEALVPPRSHAAVSDMERGVSRISAEDVARMAVLFEVPIGWFFSAPAVAHRADCGIKCCGGLCPCHTPSESKEELHGN